MIICANLWTVYLGTDGHGFEKDTAGAARWEWLNLHLSYTKV